MLWEWRCSIDSRSEAKKYFAMGLLSDGSSRMTLNSYAPLRYSIRKYTFFSSEKAFTKPTMKGNSIFCRIFLSS
jgi:hypothetical protein